MENNSFIRLNRNFFNNAIWTEPRAFSRCEAWLDLIQSARFDAAPQPKTVCIGEREVELRRGQLIGSIRYLSSRWGWTDKKTRGYLSYLRKNGMIKTAPQNGHTIITLTKYDVYNPISEGTAKGTPEGIDNAQIYSALQELRAQIGAQQRAHPEILPEKGHTEGTKNKKDKNNKILSKESTKVGSSDEQPLMFPHRGDNNSFIAFAAWITANAPYCADGANWNHGITQAEYERLINRYGYTHNEILRTVAEIENRKDLRKRYSNLYVTTFNWLKQAKKS